MPPRKTTEADAGTPDLGAAVGNADEDALLQIIEDQQQQIADANTALARLAEQVGKLAQTAASDPITSETAAAAAAFTAPELREGYKRYGSRFTDLTLVWIERRDQIIDGIPVKVPLLIDHADFGGGVFETNDPHMIEWLDNHPQLNQDFWEDSLAVKRWSNVEVTNGVKTTISSPRTPLAAPMQP